MGHHAESTVEFGGKPKTLKAYVMGFVMCFVLTAAAFLLVQQRLISDAMLYVSLSVLAVLQLMVQSVCFLGLNKGPEGKWNLLPFLFTLVVIAILVSGSLWIMYNLNDKMTEFTDLLKINN
jgi:cytochrome o ubiquinol oxidase operon protein cyoD